MIRFTFPVTGHGPVLDGGGAVADHHHWVDEPGSTPLGVPAWFAAGPAGADGCLHFLFQAAAGLEIQHLVDRFHAHPHALVVGMFPQQSVADLFR
jgi:hypothetical protein